MGRSRSQIHDKAGNVWIAGEAIIGGDERIIQVDYVTKAYDETAKVESPVRTAVIATDGNIYFMNERNARKHSSYFEAKLHDRLGVELGGLLRIKWSGNGWSIVDQPK